MNTLAFNPRREQGAVLVVALIFLLILGLIGISVAQNATLEERMSGNTRNRDLAFQAAEAAMKEGEKNIATYAAATAWDDSVTGLRTYNASLPNDAEYWKTTFNWSNSLNPPTISSLKPNNQPRFIVQKMPSLGSTDYYRITALGLSGDDSAYDPTKSQNKAVVILQAVYCYNAGGGTCS